MRCEWCCERREAEWWGETIYGAESAMCGRHKDLICVKDEAGNYLCIAVEEKLRREKSHDMPQQ